MILCLRAVIKSHKLFSAVGSTQWTSKCLLRQLSQFKNIEIDRIPSDKSFIFKNLNVTTNTKKSIICLQISCRHKSFDFSGKNNSPVKNANWWTKWKRKSIQYQTTAERNKSTLLYLLSLAILTAGASYAAVPLYRMFCQVQGYGGITTTQVGHDTEKVEAMEPQKERLITIKFTADTAATMQWNFRPQQHSIDVYAGETALAFYTAKNPTEKPIDGISTYNIIPFEAGQYFNKIQCFCFEEQRLNPQEEVDMPVFFYIDPEYLEDPFLEGINTVFLSYTFFESKPGLQLPVYQ